MIKFYKDNEFSDIVLLIPVTSIAPDRTQYKPYSPQYDLNGLYVKVVLPEEDVQISGEDVILAPDVLAKVADVLAISFDKLHEQFKNRSRMF